MTIFQSKSKVVESAMRMPRRMAALTVFLGTAVVANAQGPCDNRWLQGDAIPGVDGRVNAMCVIDTDGAGPAPSELFIGGVFNVAGGVLASNIVRWDGASWRALGAGTDLVVKALVSFDPDGPGGAPPALIAAGDFTSVDGTPALRVAMWDGSAWSALGAGINGTVEALAVYDADGPGPSSPNLIAAGFFSRAGTRAASNIARWDGEEWSPLGGGTNSAVTALAVFQTEGAPAPQLIAGGSFSAAGGTQASRIASWDGVSWSALGTGVGGTVLARNVAAWNGQSWGAMGAGFQASVETLKVADLDGDGPDAEELFAGGNFLLSGATQTRYTARWDGSAWRSLGTGISSSVYAIGVFDDDADGPVPPVLVAGGEFKTAGGTPVRAVAGWDGAQWSTFGGGTNAQVSTMTAFDPDAAGPEPVQLVVGGDFTTIGDTIASRLAIGNGLSWKPMGSGSNGTVRATTTWDPDGTGPAERLLVVGGQFTQAGGTPVRNIAMWNGVSFADFPGDGLNYTGVYALTTHDFDGPAGNPPRLVAAGDFELFPQGAKDYIRHIAYWENGNWRPIGTGSMTGYPLCMTAFDFDGSGPDLPALVIGGTLTDIDTMPHLHVAYWSGTEWRSLGSGLGNDGSQFVLALAPFDPDGPGPTPERLVAGGTFRFGGDGSPLSNIAQWDGSAWQPLGGGTDGFVSRLLTYRIGALDPPKLLVLGTFGSVGGMPARSVAAWDGAMWSVFGEGIGTTAGNAAIPGAATVFQPEGATIPKLFFAGDFTRTGKVVSASVAQWGVETAVWASPSSGVFEAGQAWACGRSPGTLDRVRFDAVDAGYTPGAFSVNVGTGAATAGTPVQVRTMHVATDSVTLNISGSGLEIVGENPTLGGPGLKIGGRAGVAASLIVSAVNGAPSGLTARALSLGGSPAARLELLAAGTLIEGPTGIGDADGNAELFIREQGTLEFAGSLALGVEPTSHANLAVNGAGASVTCSEPGASIDIGLRGFAEVYLGAPSGTSSGPFGPGAFVSIARLGTVSLGTIGGSSGTCTITGTGSTWATSQRKLFIGQAGVAAVNVIDGGALLTDSSEEVVVSRYDTADGSVRVAGAGSIWRESTAAITAGSGGSIIAEGGGVIEAPEIVLRRGSRLTGDSTVPAVRNAGVIEPTSQGAVPAVLTINGDLFSSVTQDGIVNAGVIAIDAAAPCSGGTDRVHVNGHAALAGTLRFSLAPGLDPLPGSRFTLLTAAGGLSGRFDIATFPGLSGRFFRVEYLAGDARTPASVSVVVETQTTGGFRSSTFSTPGAPAAACLADLNADAFADLVMVVPDAQEPESQPGQLVVLLNAGQGSSGWNGFASSQQTFATGRAPLAVAPGNFRGSGTPTDIAVACATDNQVRVHRNNGSGDLSASSAFPSGGLRPVGLGVADLEDDGDADIAVVNFGDLAPPPEVQLPDRGNLRLLVNAGTGTFTLGASLSTGWYPRDLAILDVNADALPDIISADSGTDELSVFLSRPPVNGNAAYAPPVRLPTAPVPVTVEPGGLDNPKEINDVAVATLGDPAGGGAGSLMVFLNADDSGGPGGAGFGPPATIELPGTPRGLAVLNLDDDQDADLVVLVDPGQSQPIRARVVRNNTDPKSPDGGVVLALDPAPVGPVGPQLLLTGDIDGDSLDDLVLIGPEAARSGTNGNGPSGTAIDVTRSIPPCPGDLNADAEVSMADLVFLLAVFGSPGSASPDAANADLNADGVVNTRDLVRLLGRFGSICG